MARIRSAKPEFWTDPLMTALPRDIRFTFKGLFEVCADDFGFFLGDVRLVKSLVWPLDDDLTLRKIEGFLQKLHELGRIKLYEVDGIRYGQIINWHKHQRVDHPTPSRIPRENVANGSRAAREDFASVSRPRARVGERIGGDRRGKEADSGKERGASDEPGSAAALVAPLPKVDYPTLASDQPLPTTLERLEDLPAERRVMTEAEVRERFETPAHSPNSGIAAIPEDEYESAPRADARSAAGLDKAGPDNPDTQSRSEHSVTSRPDNPAGALDLVLPVAAVKFGRTFYPRGVASDARRLDVFEQMLQLLKPEGLAFNGGVIRVTPARLSSACLAVLKAHTKTPLEDADAALPYLLVKLSDVSQDSPTEKAAVDAKVEEQSDRQTFKERKLMALEVATRHPGKLVELEAAAEKIFPGKAKEMAQPREAYVIAQLLKLAVNEATDEVLT